MVILDTDILVGLLRNNQEAELKIEELEQKGIPVCTTVISSYELFKGVFLSSNPVRNAVSVMELLDSITILHFDFDASKISAKVYSNLKKQGAITNVMDQMIASVAISQNQALITRNTKHYENIRGIAIENW